MSLTAFALWACGDNDERLGFNADITGGYTDTPVSGDPATGDGE